MSMLISAFARWDLRRRHGRALRLGVCLTISLACWCPSLCCASANSTCDNISDASSVAICALAASPELRNQEHEVQVLSGQRLRARSLLPSHPNVQVSLAGRRPQSTSGDVQATLNWYFSLSQEVEIAGQRSARVRVADAAISAQQRRVLVTAQEVASAALSTYYNILAETELAVLGREVEVIAQKLAAVSAARAQAELGAAIDAHIAQAEATRLSSLRYEAERRVSDLRQKLALQLGQAEIGTLQGSLDRIPGFDSTQEQTEVLVTQALALRADIMAARLEQELRMARVQVLNRERVPNLTLSFIAQRDGFDEQVFGGGIALPLPLPAPLGTSRAGEIISANAQAAQAGVAVERLQRQVRMEVMRATEQERSYAMQAGLYPAALLTQARADLAALAGALTARQLAPQGVLVAQRSLVEFLMGHVELRRGVALARVERMRVAAQPLVLRTEGGH